MIDSGFIISRFVTEEKLPDLFGKFLDIGYCLILKIYFKYRIYFFLVVTTTLEIRTTLQKSIYLCKIKLFYFAIIALATIKFQQISNHYWIVLYWQFRNIVSYFIVLFYCIGERESFSITESSCLSLKITSRKFLRSLCQDENLLINVGALSLLSTP